MSRSCCGTASSAGSTAAASGSGASPVSAIIRFRTAGMRGSFFVNGRQLDNNRFGNSDAFQHLVDSLTGKGRR